MSETRNVPRLDNHKFAREHVEAWKFIKANLVGAVAAAPEVVAYMLLCPLLTRLSVSYLPDFFLFDMILRSQDDTAAFAPAVLVYAFIISTFIGQGLGFVLNRKVAFHSNSNVALSTFLAILLILFTIVASGFVGPAVVSLVARIPFLPDSLVQLFGKLFSMAATVAWIYPANRFIIHRQKKEPPEAQRKKEEQS